MTNSTPLLRKRQQGVILFVALIVLVAMSLTGIALMRSVDTNLLVAGNLAFRQGATAASDWGVEAARAFFRSLTPITMSPSRSTFFSQVSSSIALERAWRRAGLSSFTARSTPARNSSFEWPMKHAPSRPFAGFSASARSSFTVDS